METYEQVLERTKVRLGEQEERLLTFGRMTNHYIVEVGAYTITDNSIRYSSQLKYVCNYGDKNWYVNITTHPTLLSETIAYCIADFLREKKVNNHIRVFTAIDWYKKEIAANKHVIEVLEQHLLTSS
jgi:hypothetical protein